MSAASVHVDGGRGVSVTVTSVNLHVNSALMLHPLTALCHNIHSCNEARLALHRMYSGSLL